MRKRELWVRKSQKRKRRKDDRGIVDLMRIMHHFFRNLPEWVGEMEDSRHLSYVTYTQNDLIYMGILKNICSLKTMREMEDMFNEECCIDTLRILSGNRNLREMPHSDTLNYYLKKLSPECMSELRRKMVKSLIRMKTFSRGKLLGQYWRVIIDGTGLFYFKERHCENCLVQVVTGKDGKKTKAYFHKVLEAKLVLSEKIVISLGTEFIENEKEDVTKQDCEINAAKRLLKRLKKEYPRLPVCLQGDALYEAETIMALCRENRWHYIFTQKESRQKLLGESFDWVKGGDGAEERAGIGKEKGTGRYVNHLEETTGKEEITNVFEYEYEEKQKNRRSKRAVFQWVTDLDLIQKNLEEMVEAARGRWKIENEGFNNQKNGIYDIEHLNSRNSNAMKNHYLLTQIADIIMQLYLAWNPLVREIGQSIKKYILKVIGKFSRTTYNK
ncbi:MAG: hypothetical protein LUC94_03670 [Clostridiales bacterium]|nr:hypothetical protein [Clostridiales bacterium]